MFWYYIKVHGQSKRFTEKGLDPSLSRIANQHNSHSAIINTNFFSDKTLTQKLLPAPMQQKCQKDIVRIVSPYIFYQ